MKGVRTFIAIPLPAEVRARITEHIGGLRRALPDVRASWVRENNLHLTLKFLGDVPASDISKVSAAAEIAVQSTPPFQIGVSGCGLFPPRGRPNVLWIGLEGAEGQLEELQSRIEDECGKAGFPREARPFHPHLTIARLRKSGGARQLADLHENVGFSRESFTASEVIVFRSELGSEGSKHTVISRHNLG